MVMDTIILVGGVITYCKVFLYINAVEATVKGEVS